jgi:hypothetical protein
MMTAPASSNIRLRGSAAWMTAGNGSLLPCEPGRQFAAAACNKNRRRYA